MAAEVCGPAFPISAASTSLTRARDGWCRENEQVNCREYFEDFESAFSDAWTEHRTTLIGEVSKPDLRGRDIRNARLEDSSLVGVNLENTKLDDAFMARTNLEGSNLSGASLKNAFLLSSKLHRTDFAGASLVDTDLSSTIMYDTNFHVADLTGAKFSYARIDRAYFGSAKLPDVGIPSPRSVGQTSLSP